MGNLDDTVTNGVNPTCPKCGFPVKPWAKTKCDVCHRTFCQGHRPNFDFSDLSHVKKITFWTCDDCKNKMAGFNR